MVAINYTHDPIVIMKQIQRLLIVKTSSMGDVIHMLPAVTDMARACPQLQIDWAVEEGFSSIPAWHTAVKNTIPVAVRRWRKNILTASTWQQVRKVRKQFRENDYDLVLDSQGLFKSAVVSSWAKKPVAGMDKQSVREGLASWFYRDSYPVPRGQHAVPRNRQLAAQVLGYSLQDMPLDYGVANHFLKDDFAGNNSKKFGDEIKLPERFVIFLHAASTPKKEWPVSQWISLGHEMNKRGLSVLLPWGNEREQGNAQAIADQLKQAIVLPRLGLNDLAKLFVQAEALVGEDSGLSHMAAALDRPIVALYLVTDPVLTGVMGSEVGGGCRVKNLQVIGEDQDVGKVMDVLNDWLPATD